MRYPIESVSALDFTPAFYAGGEANDDRTPELAAIGPQAELEVVGIILRRGHNGG